MTGFLLDTNVLSEFSRRGEPDARVKRWLTQTEDRFLFTSVLALAEIRQGIERTLRTRQAAGRPGRMARTGFAALL
jgi:predicted nucleic acid-binding protein